MPIAVAKLGWGSQVGMGCVCSVSSGGAGRPRPQASQAWLRHPVFQAQARGEGGEGRAGERGEGKREELGKGREGKGGEGEGQSGPLCVCVFVCAHVGGPHNVPLVCLTGGGSQGSSPLGAPPGGRPRLPTSVANPGAPGVWGGSPAAWAGGSLAPSPTHCQAHDQPGGGRRQAGQPSGHCRRGVALAPTTLGAFPTLWTSPVCPCGARSGARGGQGRVHGA